LVMWAFSISPKSPQAAICAAPNGEQYFETPFKRTFERFPELARGPIPTGVEMHPEDTDAAREKSRLRIAKLIRGLACPDRPARFGAARELADFGPHAKEAVGPSWSFCPEKTNCCRSKSSRA
jgi:hypothetical protein